MKKIQGVTVGFAKCPDGRQLSREIGRLHAEVVERKLRESNFSPEEKIVVVDRILEELKLRK